MTTAPDLADLADLADIARRLAALLDRCRGLLVPARVHSLDVLARPGARKHDWFAGVPGWCADWPSRALAASPRRW